MKKITQYVISALIAIFIVFVAMLNISKAYSVNSSNSILNRIKSSGSNLGGTLPLRYAVMTSRNDLYCLQHGASLKGWHMYTVKQYIKIDGNVATNPNTGASVSHNLNGTFAYIIAQDGGYGVQNGYTSTQRAIYAIVNNWYAQVGNQLGINWTSAKNNAYKPNTIYNKGLEYSQSIGNNTQAIQPTDNTNRDNLKIEPYSYSDGVSYVRVGPFNWNFSGTFEEIILKGDGGQELYINNTSKNNLMISRYEGNNEVWINPNQMVSGENFYLTIRADSGINTIQSIEAKGKQNVSSVISAELWFLASADSQNMLLVNHGSTNVPQDISIRIENIPIPKNLVIQKVDQDNPNITLGNVGFIFYNQEIGKYIKQTNGAFTYTPNREEATEFFTNTVDGKIALNGILPGTYIAYETKNPNEGYRPKTEGTTIPIDVFEYTIKNAQVYVKLSGYVWQDIPSEKRSIRNDLYKENPEYDNEDIRVAGVIVKLRDKTTGEIVKNPETGENQETKTSENGEYQFANVEIEKLANYYVEFTYDGLTYQNVVPHLDKDNGSKAVEPNRQEYNNRFATVEAGTKENEAVIKDASGNVQATVEYEFEEQLNGRIGKIVNKNNCDITANTNAANYTINFVKGSGVKEIKNINLGIYERRQADLALQNELDQVKVEIEGYGHIYKYGSGFSTADQTENQRSWNLGVRFENPYKNVYKRPIYRADAEYDNEDDRNKELKVALTYKITLANQEAVSSKVNSIVDYFDARYTIKGIGTGVNELDGTIINPINYRESKYNDKYNKVDIDADILIPQSGQDTTADKATQKSIYVQFDLSRENILAMLNTASIYQNDENKLEEANQNLKNTAEITSFTTYSDDNATALYAAVDKDSIPGNATLEKYSTYEDDTDKASSLAIVIANAREVSGTIFEDLEEEELSKTKNISQGDGTYDASKENAIGGVKVQLVKVDGNGNITNEVAKIYDEQVVNEDGSIGAWTDANAEAVTDSDGSYHIAGFIPGQYAIKYIWGDGSYKIIDGQKGDDYASMVENYKATVIDYDKAQSEEKNKKFYRDANESEVRTSHAMDDIATRKNVDDTLKEYNYESKTEVTQMTSTTPIMEFNIEYDDNDLLSIDLNRVENRIAFKIKNIDFGIIRRPKQDVNFVKTLSKIKLTLANGQVLVDAKIENNQLVGEANYTTYMPPIKENGITVDNGYLKIEMDEKLIQGAQVEMEFRLTTENTSQADYIGRTGDINQDYGYYQYGESFYQKVVKEEQKDTDVITLTPSKIVDYLDPKSVYQADDETNLEYRWQQLSVEDLKNEKLVASNITDALQQGSYDTGEKDENGNAIIGELDQSQIFTTDYLLVNGAKLKPVYAKGDTLTSADGGSVFMVVNKVLSSAEDADFQNQSELVLLSKPGGGKFTPTPGNYMPNYQNTETDDSSSPQVIIVPSTGGNKEYILPITIGVIAFVILAAGIVIIKKKVLKADK